MHDPIAQFSQWLTEAKACATITEPTAMTLATATRTGMTSARIVLLKDHSANGFTFYTNLESRKSAELIENPQAALCFYWMPLTRQVRIEGSITRVDDRVADAYFASRGREKQIGAWASEQSRPMAGRAELEARIARFEKQFEGGPVPRPPHWSGWCVVPRHIEFWSQGDFRLHERNVFTRHDGGRWQHGMIYP